MNILGVNAAVSLDIVFAAVIVLGIIIGLLRGFIKCILKFAGTIFALVVAISFCVPLSSGLESAFGLTTTLSQSMNPTIAGWVAVAISFVGLVLLVKLGTWLLAKVGTKLVEKSNVLKGLNRFLGALFGLAFALVILFFLLTACRMLNIDVVNEFIRSSYVVGKIYDWEWFVNATALPWRA